MTIQRLKTKLLGDIQLLNELGRGGFGVVHLAQSSNGDQFAAKIIGPLSPATDLYSIGVMLFEALTGHPPFDSSDLIQLRNLHLYTPASRVRASNAAVPEYLDGIVKKLLEKEPGKRYQTAHPSRTPSKDVSEIVGKIRQNLDAEEQQVLKERAQLEAAQSEVARVRYKERELADVMDEVVAEINGHLPDAKIVKQARGGGDIVYQLGGRSLALHFFAQNEMFRNPEVPGRMAKLRDRHVVHGGYIEIKQNGEDREGWNLVLVRPPDSMYGDWILVETDVSALTGRSARYKPFATEAKLFADNLACHWAPAMHKFIIPPQKKRLSHSRTF